MKLKIQHLLVGLPLIAIAVYHGIQAYVAAGGPDLVLHGSGVLAGVLGLVALLMKSPLGPVIAKELQNAARVLLPIALCFSLAGTNLLTGCTPAQAANVVSTISGYLQYVTTFVQGAQVLWPIVVSLLGSSQQADANAAFAKAMQAVTDSLAAMEDALAAAKAANDPNPDLSAIIAQCQAAVAQVMNVVHLYSKSSGAVGGGLTTLERQAAYIASWR